MVAGLVLASALPLRAQNPARGSIGVVVQDSAGDPLSGALVTLSQPATGLVLDATSDRHGTLSFRFLPAGDYELRVEHLSFRPQLIRFLPARAGGHLEVLASLTAAPMNVTAIDTVDFLGATLRHGPAGLHQAVPRELLMTPRQPSSHIGSLGRLFSVTDESLATEGLPASLSALAFDGFLFRPARHPLLQNTALLTTAFSLDALEAAELNTGSLNAGWSGVAGGVLSASSLRAGSGVHGQAGGAWAGSLVPVQSFDDARFNQFQGSFRLSGTPGDGTARFVVGVEAKRLRTPFSAAWATTPEAEMVAQLGAGYGVDLSAYAAPEVLAGNAVTGFGHVEWLLSTRHQIEGTLQFSSTADQALPDPARRFLSRLSGTDLLAGFSARSSFSELLDNELQISLTHSERRGSDQETLPLSHIVSHDFAIGAAAGDDVQEQVIRLRDALTYRRAAHTFEIGGSLEIARHRFDGAPARNEYFFGSPAEYAAGEGVYVRSSGYAGVADWSTLIPGLFVQDRWSVVPGLEVRLGAHAEREGLPSAEVDRAVDWFRLTRLANDSVEDAQWHISPRLGLSWDVNRAHRFIVTAAAGVFYDRVDPLLLAAWQTDDGRATSGRSIGTLSWPEVPPLPGTPRLTLVAPGLEAPRNTRLSAGLTYRFTGGATASFAAVARRTEGLPRRTDINLLPQPSFRDQYGRAVYGTLVKRGGLLTVEPGTGRRFAEFDEVSALASDGWSEYRGATVGVETQPLSWLALIARYTLSKTTDNWFGGRVGGWAVALPQGLTAADWAEGASDFDVPHRAAIGAVVSVGSHLRIATTYRAQSGQTFTPGFRYGVDANADGFAQNDPAFVDAQLPGMDALITEWDCLRASAGTYAERNSCRGPAVHSLDMGASWMLPRWAGATGAVEVNVANLLASTRNEPDAALYLIPVEGSLVTDAISRSVRVPLALNPSFGEAVARREAGRMLSIGIRVNW